MPWKETCVMEERMKFVMERELEELPLAALCRKYGVSRPVGYKWLRRYEEGGVEGLRDRSRAPKHHPNGVPAQMEEAIVQLRTKRRYWGPRKIRARLVRRHPQQKWPAASTIGEILKRHGLTVPRKGRRRAPPSGRPLSKSEGPNTLWCADFKGWFRTGDARRCDPLTILDHWSRYLLRCQLVHDTGYEATRALFEAAFCQYGLPQVIRTDNGAPFASHGIRGLSKLSVWWLALGIRPERIDPGRPQQNGVQERLHRTLKQETACAPASTWRAQQRRLNRFRDEYNQERPHESLGQEVPASLYEPSPRAYPDRLPEPEYADQLLQRRVQISGEFYWKQHKVFLGEALAKQIIGLEPLDDRYYRVYFTDFELGILDSHGSKMLSQREQAKLGSRFAQADPQSLLRSASETLGSAVNHKKCKPCPRSKV